MVRALNWLKGLSGLRAEESGSDPYGGLGAFVEYLRGAVTAAGVHITPQKAQEISSVDACLTILSEQIASLPFVVYRRLPNGGKERARDHWLYPILRGKAGRDATTIELLEVMNRDVEVHFLASHTHEKGIRFTFAPFDGKETGDIFYENTDWHDPMIVQYNPPMVVPKGTGFEWACTWYNDTDETITYGATSQDEMCNPSMVFTPFDMSAECEVVETSDGVLWSPDE